MRPTSWASGGQGASGWTERPAARTAEPARSSGSLRLADEALHRRRHACPMARPVLDAVERDSQRLLAAGSHRVVEPDALDEATVASHARVGHHDVEERALLCATA